MFQRTTLQRNLNIDKNIQEYSIEYSSVYICEERLKKKTIKIKIPLKNNKACNQ